MSIADKLTTVAENVPKVYEAGKINFGRKKSVSGEALYLDDINPNEHNMDLSIKSKNLFNVNGSLSDSVGFTSGVVSLLEDGTIKTTANFANGRGKGQFIPVSPNTTYTVQYINIASENVANGSVVQILSYNISNDETILTRSVSNYTGSYSFTFTTLDDTEYIWISFSGSFGSNDGYTIYDKVQLELGSVATDYTPYVDVSTVNVTACGKNLFDISDVRTEDTYSIVDDVVEMKWANWVAARTVTLNKGLFIPKGVYTVSADILKSSETVQTLILYMSIETDYSDNSAFNRNVPVTMSAYDVWERHSAAIVIGEDTLFTGVQIQSSGTAGRDKDCKLFFKNVQVERVDDAADYEPYNGTTYTPNADGTIEGVTSSSPIINIFTDTAGVIINAEYYQDVENFNEDSERKTWWSVITANGAKTDCQSLFRNADISLIGGFNPPTTIKPTYAQYMFNHTKNLFVLKKEDIDFGNCLSMHYCCTHCEQLIEIEQIDWTGFATQDAQNMYALSECYALETIGKIIVREDGSIMSSSHPFVNCTALKNIAFEGALMGNISFQWSSRLTVESAINIITHLKDFNALTYDEGAWNYVITFHSNTWALLENEGTTAPNGTTWKQYINHKKWDYT